MQLVMPQSLEMFVSGIFSDCLEGQQVEKSNQSREDEGKGKLSCGKSLQRAANPAILMFSCNFAP